MTNRARWIPLGLAVIFAAGLALAQQTVTANQGQPGRFGPWSVTSSSSSSSISTTPQTCSSPTHKVTSVGTSAGNTPSSQLASRRFITLCVSQEETTTIKVKCRIDGTTPVMGETNPGDVMVTGDCLTYVIGAGVTPQCISDTAATAVTSIECT